MPPSLSDWLPEDHLAWFIIDLVAELDLAEMYASLRADGRGDASYHPEMMLGVLLYAYCVGERSSRRIERRLTEDVAFRVVAANQCPDHATLARFRSRHREAITGLFRRCWGCVSPRDWCRPGWWLSIPPRWRRTLRHGRTALAVRSPTRSWRRPKRSTLPKTKSLGNDGVMSSQTSGLVGMTGVLGLVRPCGSSTLKEPPTGKSYMAERQAKEAELGRKLPGRKPRKGSDHRGKTRQANTTDPDSRMLRARNRFLQDYNAQAAVSEDQIVVAAELTNAANDSTQLVPMIDITRQNLAKAESPDVGTFVADAGYWSAENLSRVVDIDVLVAPMPATSGITDPDDPRRKQRQAVIQRVKAGEITVRKAAEEMGVSATWVRKLLSDHRRGIAEPAQLRIEMEERLASKTGAAAYAKRKTTVEPVFGNLKANLGFRRFSQRGPAATSSEWRLICTIHNLLKLHLHQLATT